jgi:hypothetical protein
MMSLKVSSPTLERERIEKNKLWVGSLISLPGYVDILFSFKLPQTWLLEMEESGFL